MAIVKVLRKVVERRYYRFTNTPRGAKDTVTCVLECGHTARFKGSKEPKTKAGCYECGVINENAKVLANRK